jgi:hypothetical protein
MSPQATPEGKPGRTARRRPVSGNVEAFIGSIADDFGIDIA